MSSGVLTSTQLNEAVQMMRVLSSQIFQRGTVKVMKTLRCSLRIAAIKEIGGDEDGRESLEDQKISININFSERLEFSWK